MKNFWVELVFEFILDGLLLMAACWCFGRPLFSLKETLGIFIILKLLRIELRHNSTKKQEKGEKDE